MNASWYIKKYKWLKARPTLSKAIITLCHILSDAIYLAYIVSVGLLFIKHDARIWAFIGVPAIGFLTETLLRAKLNWPRPYEVLPVPALEPKDTKGKSFPSRHAFSAAILSIAFYTLHPILGACLLLFTILIGLCRVLMGVHWIRDVVVGILFGWLFGGIGFFLFTKKDSTCCLFLYLPASAATATGAATRESTKGFRRRGSS